VTPSGDEGPVQGFGAFEPELDDAVDRQVLVADRRLAPRGRRSGSADTCARPGSHAPGAMSTRHSCLKVPVIRRAGAAAATPFDQRSVAAGGIN
jgi:hypothetical protein